MSLLSLNTPSTESSMIDVSIIIPTRNEAPRLAEAIEHARDLSPREIIVSDGCSKDGTPALAREMGCQVIEGPPGRGVQLNRAARRARGKVLLFLHADNWLSYDAREQLAAVFTQGDVQIGAFRQSILARERVYRLLEQGNAWRVLWRGLPYGDQGIFVRREFFQKLGGFPEVALVEDVLFMQQARRTAWPVLLPGPLYVSPRRWQRHGPVRQTLRNWGILAAHGLGVSPGRLARFYRRHDQ